MNQAPAFLTLADRKLAYQQVRASLERKGQPSLIFLGGFASDMEGSKATFFHEQCQKAGYGYLRFDYRGHGLSSDRFEEGCIGDWLDDAVKVMDELTEGPQILIGSSMGGWISLLLAGLRPEKVAGFVGIAAAPDFTEDLIRPTMTSAQTEALLQGGFFYEKDVKDLGPDEHHLPITRRLMEDGVNHLVLRRPLAINGPVRLFQGQRDTEVPWQTALKIAAHLQGDDVAVTLIKDADHRLSRAQDLALIWRSIEAMMES